MQVRLITLLCLIVLFLANSSSHAQEINFENLTFGLNTFITKSEGDLSKFWKDAVGIGPLARYKLSEDFYLEGGLAFSKFNLRASSDVEKIPQFILISMPAELKFSYALIANASVSISGGIENNTFIFSGEAADKLEENFIESEFGLIFSVGLHTKISDLLEVELYGKSQSIFSSPEKIFIKYFGLKIYISI